MTGKKDDSNNDARKTFHSTANPAIFPTTVKWNETTHKLVVEYFVNFVFDEVIRKLQSLFKMC